MLVGHHGAAFACKRIGPQVPLGILLAASLLPDLLVSVDQLVGIEHARTTPGITAFSGLDAYDVAISHSLATDLLWSALAAAAYFWRRRAKRGALAVGTAVFSHWILDFVTHRPELPLAPGVHRYVGLGLWNSIPLTFLIEGALWVACIAIYLRATRATARGGTIGLGRMYLLSQANSHGGAFTGQRRHFERASQHAHTLPQAAEPQPRSTGARRRIESAAIIGDDRSPFTPRARFIAVSTRTFRRLL